MKPEFKNKPPKAPFFEPNHLANYQVIHNQVMFDVDHVLMDGAFAWHFTYYANINGMWYQKDNGEFIDAWKHDIRYDKILYHENGVQCWYLEYQAYLNICEHYRLNVIEVPERLLKVSIL